MGSDLTESLPSLTDRGGDLPELLQGQEDEDDEVYQANQKEDAAGR